MPEQQPELIAADEPGRPALPARIADMITIHGPGPAGQTCQYCARLIVIHRNRAFYKCSQATITAGAATDWRTKWPACGKFDRETVDNRKRHIWPSD